MTYSNACGLFLMVLSPLYIHAGCQIPEAPNEISTRQAPAHNPFINAALIQTNVLLKSSDSSSIETLSALKARLEEYQQRLRRK